MTAPAVAALRFWNACLIGVGLGAVYGFLRPLRPKCTALADGLFVLCALLAWLHLGFQICGGDVRLAYSGGLVLGCAAFEWTAGRWLRPVFGGFWEIVGKMWGILAFPVKKILKFLKKMFASGEKWVTIRWRNRRLRPRVFGGTPDGRTERILQSDQGGLPAQLQSDEGGRDHHHRIVYGRADHPASFHD